MLSARLGPPAEPRVAARVPRLGSGSLTAKLLQSLSDAEGKRAEYISRVHLRKYVCMYVCMMYMCMYMHVYACMHVPGMECRAQPRCLT